MIVLQIEPRNCAVVLSALRTRRLSVLLLALLGARLAHRIADLGDGALQAIEHRSELSTLDEHAIDAEALVAFGELRIVERGTQCRRDDIETLLRRSLRRECDDAFLE